MPLTVAILSGSVRAASLNARLARMAAAHLPAGTRVEVLDGLDRLPLYSQELDEAGAPGSVEALRGAIARAGALIVATPEHNGLPSAIVKNAVDWASRPRDDASLAGLPALVLSATPSPRGGAWAIEAMVRLLEVAGARPLAPAVGVGRAARPSPTGASRSSTSV